MSGTETRHVADIIGQDILVAHVCLRLCAATRVDLPDVVGTTWMRRTRYLASVNPAQLSAEQKEMRESRYTRLKATGPGRFITIGVAQKPLARSRGRSGWMSELPSRYVVQDKVLRVCAWDFA